MFSSIVVEFVIVNYNQMIIEHINEKRVIFQADGPRPC
jgi:hypothetical protein